MQEQIKEIESELSKSYDLLKALCDAMESCRRNCRHTVHLQTLCDILLEQNIKAVSLFDDFAEKYLE